MSQRPTLNAFRQDIQSILGKTCFTPPVEKIAEDFWNYWTELETALAEGSVSLSIDTLLLAAEYKRYGAWKGAAKIILLLAIVITWFQWVVGVIVGLVGLALHKYGEHLRKTDGQLFMKGLINSVAGNVPGGMANLCAHYIAGAIELVSSRALNQNCLHRTNQTLYELDNGLRACWPLYPSNVITGRNTHVELPPSSPPSSLKRISQVLGQAATQNSMLNLHELNSGNKQRQNEKEALGSLLSYCETTPNVRDIMAEFNATRETLIELYDTLIIEGAGQWAGEHFVPASAIAYPHTLRYLLKHPPSEPDHWLHAAKLISYFSNGESLE